MKKFLVASLLLPVVAAANPGVKKDTDIGKNKVAKHHQVTWDKGQGTTQTVSVTVFDRAQKEQHFRQECVVSVQGKKRFSTCQTVQIKDRPTVTQEPAGVTFVARAPSNGTQGATQVTEKTISKKVSHDDRLMFHAGYGPVGLETEEGVNGTRVKEARGVILGVGYSRHITSGLNLGVSVYSNELIAGTIGVDLQ